MHVLTWRDQGDRQLHGARQAYRRRAPACARDLAHVPAHLHARTGPDRFLHPQRDLRSNQAHPRNRHERASNRPQVHRAIRLFSLPRAIARESSNLPQMRLGPLLAQFVAHSGGPGAASWRRAPRDPLPRRSGSPCHGALADVRLTTGQPLGKSSTPVSATDHCSFGTNSVISEPDRPPTDACSRSIARARSRITKTSASSGSKSPTMSGVGFRASSIVSASQGPDWTTASGRGWLVNPSGRRTGPEHAKAGPPRGPDQRGRARLSELARSGTSHRGDAQARASRLAAGPRPLDPRDSAIP